MLAAPNSPFSQQFSACYPEGEADAWLLKGMCEMEAGDASTAVHSFHKVLTLHTKADRIDGICEIHIYLSLAYQK